MSPLTSFMDGLLDESASFEIQIDNAKVHSDSELGSCGEDSSDEESSVPPSRTPIHDVSSTKFTSSSSLSGRSNRMNRFRASTCPVVEKRVTRWETHVKTELKLATPKRSISPLRFTNPKEKGLGMRMRLGDIVMSSAIPLHATTAVTSSDPTISTFDIVQDAIDVCSTSPLLQRGI